MFCIFFLLFLPIYCLFIEAVRHLFRFLFLLNLLHFLLVRQFILFIFESTQIVGVLGPLIVLTHALLVFEINTNLFQALLLLLQEFLLNLQLLQWTSLRTQVTRALVDVRIAQIVGYVLYFSYFAFLLCLVARAASCDPRRSLRQEIISYVHCGR